MKCDTAEPRVLVVDEAFDWVARSTSGLSREDGALVLAPLAEGALDPSELDPHVPPPRLATTDCGSTVLLAGDDGRVRVLGPCDATFGEPRTPVLARVRDAIAVAATPRLVAVLTSREVWLVGRVRGAGPVRVPVTGGVAVALDAAGRVAIARADGHVRLVDPSGAPIGEARIALAAGEVLERVALAPSEDGALEVFGVLRDAEGRLRVRAAGAPSSSSLPSAEIAVRWPRRLEVRARAEGFCLLRCARDGGSEREWTCFDWRGAPAELPPFVEPARWVSSGVLETEPLDSGIERCRWHRIELAAEVPSGATLQIVYATSDDLAHPPSASDFCALPSNVLDALVGPAFDGADGPAPRIAHLEQIPGRYLHLRVRFGSDTGHATPRLFAITVHLPRDTSLRELPQAYMEEPAAADFTERFLAGFDAEVEDLARAIDRFPRLMDPRTAPAAALPWIASVLGTSLDPALDERERRAWLVAAPELAAARGTLHAVRLALRIALGAEPLVEELGLARAYGALRIDARLGETRLFGRSRKRVRLGASKLGLATLRSHGDPRADPIAEGAMRVRITLPATRRSAADAVALATRILALEAPAHLVIDVRAADPALAARVGSLGVGLGAGLRSPPLAVLRPTDGSRGTRLGVSGVLARAPLRP